MLGAIWNKDNESDTNSQPVGNYALGYTDAEQERLIQQAAIIAPIAERLFRDPGIGPGQRLLDLGSGMGDVAMLLARLVGLSDEVVDEPFDAAVGRFILMYFPDSVSVLRSVVHLVRPGGIVAFQEPSWAAMLALGAGLPLWSRTRHLIHETLLRSGANREIGVALYRVFQEAGLPAPKMHLEMPLGNDAEFIRLTSDLLCSLRPLAEQHKVSLQELGDLETLPDRISAEVAAANTVVSLIAVVGAWSQKPATADSVRDQPVTRK